jgi:hypothetical protein
LSVVGRRSSPKGIGQQQHPGREGDRGVARLVDRREGQHRREQQQRSQEQAEQGDRRRLAAQCIAHKQRHAPGGQREAGQQPGGQRQAEQAADITSIQAKVRQGQPQAQQRPGGDMPAAAQALVADGHGDAVDADNGQQQRQQQQPPARHGYGAAGASRRPDQGIGQQHANDGQQRKAMHKHAGQRKAERKQPGMPVVAAERAQQRPEQQRSDQDQQAVDLGVLRLPQRKGGERHEEGGDERAKG